MDFLCLLLVSLIIGSANASINNVVLCQGSQGHLNLSCNATDVIYLQNVYHPRQGCNSDSSCVNNVNHQIRTDCHMKNSCNVSLNTFSTCPKIPRQVTMRFKCKRGIFTREYTANLCTNSLDNVWCYWPAKIELTDVKVCNEQLDCDSDCNEETTKKSLEQLCNGKGECDSNNNDDNLFHETYLDISYYCTDNSTILATNSPDDTSMPTYYSTTFNDVNDPGSENMILIDKGKRVKLIFSWMNMTAVICADAWNDHGASLVCKSLRYQSGSAIQVDNRINYPITLVLNCSGNEKSLMECPETGQNCSTHMVAGVECCEDVTCSRNTSTGRKIDHNSTNSTIGISIGIPLTLIIAVTVVIICIRKRNTTTKDKKENQPRRHVVNQNEDYTGQQGFALPNTSRDATNNHNVQYTLASQSERGGSRNQTNVNTGIQLYSLASNPNKYDDSTYAASQDGVYDHAHDRRHAESEANTYGHSVDGVYDTSNQHQRYDEDGDSSYGRVVDTVYDSSSHGGVPKDNVDNTYSRTMDTSYDTASQVKGTLLQDNIYD